MASSGRPLAAAPTSQDKHSITDGIPDGEPNRQPIGGKRPKRTLVESACAACRKRKSKCDGSRPTCTRCQNLRTECVYEAEAGESRWSALKRQHSIMKTERDELREILTFLQTHLEEDALEIFHRIRRIDSQESWSTVLQAIRERSAHPTPSVVGGQIRLPPIRSMIDVSETITSPILNSDPRRQSMGSDGSAASYTSSRSGKSIATSQPPSA